MTITSLLFVAILVVCHREGAAFAVPRLNPARSLTTSRSMSTAETDSEVATTSKGLMTRDRYVATNRFAVRKGQGPKFEKRWATRKSRLAELDGFRHFHLMRRVVLNGDGNTSYNGGDSDEGAQENYVSFTVWNKKSDFSAWRNGEAFKEAHGGTSIGAFISTMVNSALVLRGPPRPAFYDALLMQSVRPESIPETVDGWRQIEADGVTNLPVECFVSMEKYYVPLDKAAVFEKELASHKIAMAEGTLVATLMRRDGQAKGHGVVEMSMDEPSYVATRIYKDQAAFDSALKKTRPFSSDDKLWSREPEMILYEGTLVITNTHGA
jgi:heme-degrading monooxygenase HmoA